MKNCESISIHVYDVSLTFRIHTDFNGVVIVQNYLKSVGRDAWAAEASMSNIKSSFMSCTFFELCLFSSSSSSFGKLSMVTMGWHWIEQCQIMVNKWFGCVNMLLVEKGNELEYGSFL